MKKIIYEGSNNVSKEVLDYDRNMFCINGKLIPSFFVIGIQKCGTTTVDAILLRFQEVSHGIKIKNERHFFDNENSNVKKYYSEFPNCDATNIVRSYDVTPNYTNPSSESPERIKRLYDKLGIPLNKLIFIAIVCPNSRRIPSAYHMFLHSPRHESLKAPVNDTLNKKFPFNSWFSWVTRHLELDTHSVIKRGVYDVVFGKYFEIYPQSTFLIIDNTYAFQQEQDLSNFLAAELNLPERKVPYIHKNRGRNKKEALSKDNLKWLQWYYNVHERKFLGIVRKTKNVKTFPKKGFMKNWSF